MRSAPFRRRRGPSLPPPRRISSACCATTFDFQKINYLALMMVDPHVHFHVIPRYSGSREFAGSTFADATWPKPPDVTSALPLTPAQMGLLHSTLRAAWR